MVPRKLYKAWDRENKTMIALKFVEICGFSAASAWEQQHLAVPSSCVRYALFNDACVAVPSLCVRYALLTGRNLQVP